MEKIEEGYLNERGKEILEMILNHCRDCKLPRDQMKFEASMLANSFALYEECAKHCNENGVTMEFQTEKGGVYQQIRPEYTAMKNEDQNILKHSPKFGLNPADFDKIFKGSNKPKKKEL